MPQNAAFHQGLHCLQRLNRSLEKELHFIFILHAFNLWGGWGGRDYILPVTPKYIHWINMDKSVPMSNIWNIRISDGCVYA